MVTNKTKKPFEVLKWILTIAAPLVIGIAVTIFSYGVQAGDYIDRIETAEKLSVENTKTLSETVFSVELIRREVLNEKQANIKLTDILSALVSSYTESKLEMSILNANLKTNTDYLVENFKYLQGRFDRLEDRLNKNNK